MTEEQFETLVNLIRVLALEAVNDGRPMHDKRCDNSADIAATIAYARSQFQDEFCDVCGARIGKDADACSQCG